MILLVSIAHASFGPYLQDLRADGITVCAQLDVAAECDLDYGRASTAEHSVLSGAAERHEIVLTGLEPSASYVYELRCEDVLSGSGSFSTPVFTDEPFRFVVVGDTRTDGDEHQIVIDQVVATAGYPELYFNTGDLVEDGGASDQWADFFAFEAPLMRGTTLFPAAGNHDDYAMDSYYAEYFDLPQDDSGTEGWYALRYGNSVFLALDSNDDFVTGSEQYQWAESTLQAADADPTVRHIFAFWHHPAYSSGGHGVMDPEEWQQVRTYLAPLMADYGVDVVFNGHDHHYERSDASMTDGVTWIVTGGGGAPGAPEDFVDGADSLVSYLGMAPGQTLGEYLEENSVARWILESLGVGTEYEDGWWRAEAEVMKHFIVVEVQGDYVEATVYTDQGEVFETWSLGSYDGDQVDDDGDAWTEEQGDCDDADASVNPGATDECDGVDNDCDGVDNGCDTGDDTGAGADDTGTDDTGHAGAGDDSGGVVTAEPTGCSCASAGGGRLGGLFGLGLLGLAVWRRRVV